MLALSSRYLRPPPALPALGPALGRRQRRQRSRAVGKGFAATAVAALLALVGASSGCTSHTVRVVDTTPPEQLPNIEEDLLLDVGVAVFDSNVPDAFDDQVAQNITQEVRRAEANYMAYFAKNLLQSTGNWGAVRVVPRQTHAVHVAVSGRIVHSDGERLILQAQVRDARGKLWFDTSYECLASKYAYGDSVPPGIDPFQAVYRQLADDMLAYRKTLSEADIQAIRTTAEMRFARQMAPDAFADYVVEVGKKDDAARQPALFEVRRLPSEDDPMLGRVRKVREREYLFIDTLDEYFADFNTRMYSSYQNWRQATYSEAIAYRQQRQKARRRAIAGAVGIAAGLAGQASDTRVVRYGGAVSIIGGAMAVGKALQDYADAKVHSEVLHEMGVSAEAEISPHTIELENRTISLQGTVAAQYEQLRSVLKQIYYEELGLSLQDGPQAQPTEAEDLDDRLDARL